jgi:hypothetical protein
MGTTLSKVIRQPGIMFSSLVSYLLGNQSHEPDLPRDVETADGLRAVEGDDDWVLDEVNGDNSSETLEESREDLPELELVIITVPHSFSSETLEESREDLPELELVIIPVPHSFSSETLEESREDLPELELVIILVPHSFSSGSADSVSASPASSVSGDSDPFHAVGHVRRIQEKECVQLRSAQKLRQRRSCQLLKRNHLDRNNKAREINSRNQCKRRSDRMQRHSGAICNRKR